MTRRRRGRLNKSPPSAPFVERGYRVSALVLDKMRSVVFVSREVAEKFARTHAYRNPVIEEVVLVDGKVVKVLK